ncbi:MAG TPA: PaaI family thioesterase [Novosphingobium sp.]|nr:PaaI family thioesterase [Novosphingobium sp.]
MSYEPHDKLLSDADTPGPSRLARVSGGEWDGWSHWEPVDDFEELAGPFYCRPDGDGILCGWHPANKNRNGGGNIHGGALMTFADFALFMIAGGMDATVHGVTVTMACEFVGAAQSGALLLARGEVTRAGGSLIFVRGKIADGERPVLTFSATLKRLKPRD